MSKVKAVLDFAEAYDATNPDKQAEHAALEAEVNLLSEQDEWEEHAIHGAVIAAIYADHVTAELQAENAALRAKVLELEKAQQWIDPAVRLPDRSCSILVLLEHYNMPSLKHQEITSFHPSPDFFNYEKHYEIVCSDECPTWARHFQCSFNHLQYTVKGWMPLPKGVAK